MKSFIHKINFGLDVNFNTQNKISMNGNRHSLKIPSII